MTSHRNRVIAVVAWLIVSTNIGYSAKKEWGDWPQWRGPNRDGISPEKGLMTQWPHEGPRVIWRIPLGEGYSGISISQGLAFTMYSRGHDEFVVALEADSGERVWRFRTDDMYTNSWGNGPRVTPTVEGDRLYTLSARSKLYALDARAGRLFWKHDLAEEFGCDIPDLGYSNSPLIESDLLIVVGGGRRPNKGVLAFDKWTGKLAWASYADHSGYSSPIAVSVNGVRQIVFFTGTSIVSVSPKDGTVIWKYPWRTSSFENVATPVFIPPDKLFFSSAHPLDKGSAVLQVITSATSVTAKILWKSNVMKNHFSTVVLHDNHLYGTDRYILKCIEATSGEEKWAARGFGEGSLILADGHHVVLGTYGDLALVEATSLRYNEVARAKPLRGKCYTPPTLANGRLYLRNESEMVCLELKHSREVHAGEKTPY